MRLRLEDDILLKLLAFGQISVDALAFVAYYQPRKHLDDNRQDLHKSDSNETM